MTPRASPAYETATCSRAKYSRSVRFLGSRQNRGSKTHASDPETSGRRMIDRGRSSATQSARSTLSESSDASTVRNWTCTITSCIPGASSLRLFRRAGSTTASVPSTSPTRTVAVDTLASKTGTAIVAATSGRRCACPACRRSGDGCTRQSRSMRAPGPSRSSTPRLAATWWVGTTSGRVDGSGSPGHRERRRSRGARSTSGSRASSGSAPSDSPG